MVERVESGTNVSHEVDRIEAERYGAIARMAAGIAYEIAGPVHDLVESLALIRELVAPLAGRAQGADTLETASHVASSASARIERVLSDLQALAGIHRAELEPVDVNLAVETAIARSGYEVESRARVEQAYAPVPPVLANGARLSHVIACLLANAAQAIPAGFAGSNVIGVRTFVDEEMRVVIEVRDTGSGIEPRDLDHVLEPFFTTKAPSMKKSAGARGLGLTYAQSAIGAWGGSISVSSTVGKGTTVRIVLPPQSGAELVVPRERESGVQEEPRPNVVVVESNPSARPAYARLLADGRARVTFASPEEALRRLALGESVDVVIVDRDLRRDTARAFHRELGRVASDVRNRTLDVSLRAVSARHADAHAMDDDDLEDGRRTSSWLIPRETH